MVRINVLTLISNFPWIFSRLYPQLVNQFEKYGISLSFDLKEDTSLER